MSTNYAKERVTTAILEYLRTLDAIPSTKEFPRVASQITEVVWAEYANAGLSGEAVEKLFASAATKSKAQKA